MNRKEREKIKHETIDGFLTKKCNILILGNNYQLSEIQRNRLQQVLDEFSYYDLYTREYSKHVSNMILYNVTNYVKRLKILSTKRIKKFSKLYFVLIYGKVEGLERYINHYNFMTQNLPTSEIYWKNKGYEENIILEKINQHQKFAASCSAQKLSGSSEYTIRSVLYWLKHGYSYDDAKEKVKNIQNTSSLQRYIERFGEKEGIEKFKIKQQKRLNTLNNKTEEEKKLINIKKGHNIESYLANGYTLEQAEKLSYTYYSKRKNYSLISQHCFEMLESKLTGKCYYKLKNYEKQICGKHVDFYYEDKKVVVEFNGDFWHCRKTKYSDDFIRYNITAKDVRLQDEERYRKILTSNDVEYILIVWESDFRKNPDEIIFKILKFLENLDGKRIDSKRIKEIV